MLIVTDDEYRKINNDIFEIVETGRIGYILPVNPFLLILFVFLKLIHIKKLIEWSRKWNCKWFLLIKTKDTYDRQELKKLETEIFKRFSDWI